MKDYLLFAIRSFKHRKLRSLLTIWGIVVGIAAIVALITVSQGLENAIVSQFETMGTDRLFITPGAVDITNYQLEGLTIDDVAVIENVQGIEWVNPYIMTKNEVYFGNEMAFSEAIMGMNTKDMDKIWGDMDFELEDGKFFEGGEKYALIIGNDVAHDFFDRDVRVGNALKINGKRFKVKAIIEKLGSPDDDRSITMPIDTFRALFEKPKEVSVIDAKAKKGININALAVKAERALKRSRDDEDFNILTPDQILSQMSDVLNIVKVVLGGIAAISLLVGGIGIMNSMYTNVLERTREIGIMKSVGATNNEILKIFLYESGMMGFVGGVIGAFLGLAVAYGVGFVAEQQGFKLLKIMVDWKLLLFGILFAFIVGALSGYFPAKQASKLNPVEALRYGQ